MWLTVRSGVDAGKSVEVAAGRLVIGRDETADLVIVDDKVSRRHAQVERLPDGRLLLSDLGSTNGTFVGEQRLERPVVLAGDELLRVGDTLIGVSAEPAPAATSATAAPPPTPPRPAAAPPPTPSRIERLMLRRSVRRAQLLAGIAGTGVVVAVVIVVLFVTGVFGGGEEEPSIPEIVAAITPSTVLVNAYVGDQQAGSGTGWVLDAEEGLIVTNHHVVNAGATFTVGVGTDERDAEIVGTAPCDDLALLRVDDVEDLAPLPLGSQADLRQGDTVVALGYPANAALGADLTATTGIVSVVETQWRLDALDVPRYPNLIQTDSAINPGNSGGPLVNLDRELVGVNSAGITLLGGRTIQGQGYAIGVDRVKELLPTLRAGTSVGWTGMGLHHPVDPAELEQLGLPADVAGLVVTHVVPRTPAAQAGFGAFPTLVVAVDGTPVDNTLQSYCEAVEGVESGETATFTVIAQGDTAVQDVEVEFE